MPRKAWGGLPIDSQNEILSKIFLFYAIKDTGGSSGVRNLPARLMHRVSWKWPQGCLKEIVICDFPLFCFPLPVIEKLFSSLRVKLMDWRLLIGAPPILTGDSFPGLASPRGPREARWSAWSAHISLCSSGRWAWRGLREGRGAALGTETTGHTAPNPCRGARLTLPRR